MGKEYYTIDELSNGIEINADIYPLTLIFNRDKYYFKKDGAVINITEDELRILKNVLNYIKHKGV